MGIITVYYFSSSRRSERRWQTTQLPNLPSRQLDVYSILKLSLTMATIKLISPTAEAFPKVRSIDTISFVIKFGGEMNMHRY